MAANTEKKVPLDWLTADKTGLNEKFVNYALPLIQGDCKAPLENGLPRFAKLKKVFVNKK
jgi:6-phosphofructokinase 1